MKVFLMEEKKWKKSLSNSLQISPKCISVQTSPLGNWQYGTGKEKKQAGVKAFYSHLGICHPLTLSQKVVQRV